MCFGLWKWKASAVMASLSAVNLMINYNYIYIYLFLTFSGPEAFLSEWAVRWSLLQRCTQPDLVDLFNRQLSTNGWWFGFRGNFVCKGRLLTGNILLGFQSNNPNPGQWLFEVWWFCDSFCFIQFFFNMFHSISYSPTVFSRQQKINLRDHFFSISDPTLKPMTDPWCYQVQHL